MATVYKFKVSCCSAFCAYPEEDIKKLIEKALWDFVDPDSGLTLESVDVEHYVEPYVKPYVEFHNKSWFVNANKWYWKITKINKYGANHAHIYRWLGFGWIYNN